MKHPVQQHFGKAHLSLLIASLLALDFGAGRLRAGTDTWTGGGAPDGNWQNANNWGGIAAPLANDTLIFTGFTQTATTNNFIGCLQGRPRWSGERRQSARAPPNVP